LSEPKIIGVIGVFGGRYAAAISKRQFSDWVDRQPGLVFRNHEAARGDGWVAILLDGDENVIGRGFVLNEIVVLPGASQARVNAAMYVLQEMVYG